MAIDVNKLTRKQKKSAAQTKSRLRKQMGQDEAEKQALKQVAGRSNGHGGSGGDEGRADAT